ncbi:MAG: STAS domain-containing protein [Planctomycetia bacterium]|nr:STAS domain-containing protein [Planctomycetia bacterium]
MSSSQPASLLRVSEEAGRITIRFAPGTTLSETTAEEFSREVTAATQNREKPHLLLDLGEVTLITSVALAKLIALNGRLRATGGRLTLYNANPIVRQVFQVTRLDTVLEVRDTADAIPV